VINTGIMANFAQSGRVLSMIMEMTEYDRKGNIMNIKENCYIYQFKQLNELIEEQKLIKMITRIVSLKF
jgi:hypothetical protein